jgi:hypothetical protein
MSGELQVTATELTELAGKHRDVVEHLAAADSVTDSATGHVTQTHGLVCGLTAAALGSAQSSRSAAVQAMQKTSTSLAGKLDTASSDYTSTDSQQSSELNGQVHP